MFSLWQQLLWFWWCLPTPVMGKNCSAGFSLCLLTFAMTLMGVNVDPINFLPQHSYSSLGKLCMVSSPLFFVSSTVDSAKLHHFVLNWLVQFFKKILRYKNSIVTFRFSFGFSLKKLLDQLTSGQINLRWTNLFQNRKDSTPSWVLWAVMRNLCSLHTDLVIFQIFAPLALRIGDTRARCVIQTLHSDGIRSQNFRHSCA